MRLKAIFDSLTFRIFVLLFATITGAFGAYALVSIRTNSRNWEESVQEGAQRFSDLIEDSTHHSMLLNRKEDVHHIIRSIVDEPGVEGVRIYDKNGAIIFSARDEEIGMSVDLQAEACVSCHSGTLPLQHVPAEGRVRIFEGANGERVLGVINAIENTADCSTAACHAHPADQSILGVLDVKMSLRDPDRRLAGMQRQALIAALLMALLVGLCTAFFLLRVVRNPVRNLTAGAERVSRGDLDTEIDPRGAGEIRQLAVTFNAMTGDLRRARAELTAWSERLEVLLDQKTDELVRTQRQVAHMDKMASLGKLAATVAHELNNPLAGVLNYAKLVERSLKEGDQSAEERESMERALGLIQREASRCGNIVRNLLTFARPSGAAFGPHPLAPIMERAVMLIAHRLEMSGIRLEKRMLAGDDRLVCDADQIQQALVALLVNAVEAMPDGGVLSLTADAVEDSIRIVITDTGSGIGEEALQHIFEPFFSSKDGAEGAGLGLAVVYGIVHRHGGRIEVESAPEGGTTFRLVLPREPTDRSAGDGRARSGSEAVPVTLESTHA